MWADRVLELSVVSLCRLAARSLEWKVALYKVR
jgi:hypothetical protein